MRFQGHAWYTGIVLIVRIIQLSVGSGLKVREAGICPCLVLVQKIFIALFHDLSDSFIKIFNAQIDSIYYLVLPRELRA
jgi:hypothetical protein